MNDFLQYWEHISSSDRILILMGGMIFFWLIEGHYPNHFGLLNMIHLPEWARLILALCLMFGTFAYTDPANLRHGLEVLEDKTDENLGYQFRLSFYKKVKTDY